ncbi:MAG: hypothetical protein R3D02_15520 [Hyphomicrobiales bacterium]
MPVFDLKRATDAAGLETVVAAMTDAIAHRGPDDAGRWVDAEAGLALGQRRLAIVDLSPAGHQPMFGQRSPRHRLQRRGL